MPAYLTKPSASVSFRRLKKHHTNSWYWQELSPIARQLVIITIYGLLHKIRGGVVAVFVELREDSIEFVTTDFHTQKVHGQLELHLFDMLWRV